MLIAFDVAHFGRTVTPLRPLLVNLSGYFVVLVLLLNHLRLEAFVYVMVRADLVVDTCFRAHPFKLHVEDG